MTDRYLLGSWLADPSLRRTLAYDLTGSHGPPPTLNALGVLPDIIDIALAYGKPTGSLAAREAVAAFVEMDAESICLTTGASEALMIALLHVRQTSGSVLLPDPGYPAVSHMVRALGMRPVTYSLDLAGRGAAQAVGIADLIDDQTRLVVVTTPHNPTARSMEDEEIRALATRLGAAGVPLLIDEVFRPIAANARSIAARYPSVWAVGDLSKGLALPGLRIGWLASRDAHFLRCASSIRAWLSVSGSPVLEHAAITGLNRSAMLIEQTKATVCANRAKLLMAMPELGAALEGHDGSPFALLPLPIDGDIFCRRLAERGVLTLPGSVFGSCRSYLRIALGGDERSFAAAVQIVGEEWRLASRAGTRP